MADDLDRHLSDGEGDALREEVRSLRLWNQHLEERLARRTEQVEIWRTRAEERKQRITALEADGPRTTGPTGRTTVRSWLRPARRPDTHPAATPRLEPPVEAGSPDLTTLPTRPRRSTHPSVRVAVVTVDADLPDLLASMDAVALDGPDLRTSLLASDVVVAIGTPGAERLRTDNDLRQWVEGGQPCLTIDAELPGVSMVTPAALDYFDPRNDLFVPGPEESGFDRDAHPTLAVAERLDDATDTRSGSTTDNRDAEERRLASRLRRLRSEHSPMAVAERLLLTAGIVVPTWRKEALAVLLSKRPDMVIEATIALTKQSYRPLRVAIGLHGRASAAESTLRGILEPSGLPHSITSFPEERPQGACLDQLVRESPGDVVLKIDDDDLYSPVYIEDMVGALSFSGADVVGKSSVYVQLGTGEMVLQPGTSYRPVEYVYGPTITTSRAAWEAVRFPNRRARVDSVFLRGIRAAGLSIVSHHPWDFCFVRHGSGHTWEASDDYFRAHGRAVDLAWPDLRTDDGAPIRPD